MAYPHKVLHDDSKDDLSGDVQHTAKVFSIVQNFWSLIINKFGNFLSRLFLSVVEYDGVLVRNCG